jgi:Fur family peroxide stress response transcriptional regulator
VSVNPAEVERRLQRFKTAARAAGVKLTHQRLEIFRAVAASVDHPDAAEVLRAVRPRLPTVSLDTVYRALWLMEGLGLVGTLGSRHASARFDANLEPHHHYVCVRCGLARDFQDPALTALRVPAAVRRLGRVASAHVELRGVCARCAGRRTAASPSTRDHFHKRPRIAKHERATT